MQKGRGWYTIRAQTIRAKALRSIERKAKMSKICQIMQLTAMGLILILAGCNGKGQGEPGAYIDREAQLLKQIDQRFENPQAHYQLGKLYHADGLYDKAQYEYNIAIGFDPVNRPAQAGLVRLLADAGRSDQAVATAGLYIDQASASAESVSLLGKAFQDAGLDEYALACYQKALDIDTESAVSHKQLGYYYLAKGDKIRAEDHLRRSFQSNPYQADVAGELGKMGIMVQMPAKSSWPSQTTDKALNEGGSR